MRNNLFCPTGHIVYSRGLQGGMIKAASFRVPAVFLIALGLLSASCAPAPSAQTNGDPTAASRRTALDPGVSKRVQATSTIPSTTYFTYRPAWLAGQALTLDGAQAQVRTFLDEPAPLLEGYFVDEAAPAAGAGGRLVVSLSNRKLFKLQRPVAGLPTPDEFTVDASSGEVIDAFLHSHAIHRVSRRLIGETQALAAAQAFGRTRFAEFDQLVLREAGISGIAGDGVPTYIVRWARRAESGARLPTALQIGVDMETGQVATYSAQRVEYRGPTDPAISRERAIELALAEAHKDIRLATPRAGRVELMTWQGAFGDWRLAWSVGLDSVPPGVMTRRFFVDALTGAILNPLGSPVG
jgi:hypothetical protein